MTRLLRQALVLLLLALPGSLASAREYAIPEIQVAAAVRGDGGVHITEARRYRFAGAYTWADYRLPLAGFTGIRDIRVAEGGRAFLNDNSGAPGTFEVSRGDGAVTIRWFYQAQDEERVFTLSFVLDGAVVVGPQWSEFFWNYLGAGREKPTAVLRVEVGLPDAAPTDSLQAWGRGGLAGVDITRTPGRFRAEAAGIGRNQSAALRTVFPSSVFTSARVTDPAFSLEQVLREERERQQALDALRRRAETAAPFIPLVIVLSLVAFAFYYNRYGRRHAVYESFAREGGLSLPSPPHKPAAVGWLLNHRQVAPRHLVATLLDLARQGYFTLQEVPREGWFARRGSRFLLAATGKAAREDLRPWETSLLDFVNARLQGQARHVDDIFGRASGKLMSWYRRWQKELKRDLAGLGWMDPASRRAALRHALVQLVLAAASAALLFITGPVAIAALAVSLAAALASGLIVRRSREGEAIHKRWQAYRKALRARRNPRVEHGLLEDHLIYATALGAGKKELEWLFQSGAESDSVIPWLAVTQAHSPAALAQSFTALTASGATAFAGTAGGGGASAGSAGGGASGGAG